MQPVRLASIGLWVFAAGMLAWTIANAVDGQVINVLTDTGIVIAAAVAAIGLPRAVEGIGAGALRGGMIVVALAQFGQNLVTALTGLAATNAAPAFVVMLASVAIFLGAKRWEEDAWSPAALPLLVVGFAGYAFEPAYYMVLQTVNGNPFGAFFPGAVLVAAGSGLASWAFAQARRAEA